MPYSSATTSNFCGTMPYDTPMPPMTSFFTSMPALVTIGIVMNTGWAFVGKLMVLLTKRDASGRIRMPALMAARNRPR